MFRMSLIRPYQNHILKAAQLHSPSIHRQESRDSRMKRPLPIGRDHRRLRLGVQGEDWCRLGLGWTVRW